jgi:hypothetical protein
MLASGLGPAAGADVANKATGPITTIVRIKVAMRVTGISLMKIF